MSNVKCKNWKCLETISNLKEKNAAYRAEIKQLKREHSLLIREYEQSVDIHIDLDDQLNKVLKSMKKTKK